MKNKLFSLKSVLVSAKGIVSSLLTGLTAIPIILLMKFLITKQIYAVAGIFGLVVLVWYLFFWGFISRKLWRWQ